MQLTDANSIYVGNTPATAAYIGNTLVWPLSDLSRTVNGSNFRTWNNLSATGQINLYDGTFYLDPYNAVMNIEPNDIEVIVGDAQHYHLYITSDDTSLTYPNYFVFYQDTKITFKYYTFTRIVFKNLDRNYSSYVNSFICSAGILSWDDDEKTIVWEGNDTDFYIDLNNITWLECKEIYFEIESPVRVTSSAQFRSYNNLNTGSLSNGVYKLTADSNLTLTTQYTTSTHRPVISNYDIYFRYSDNSSEYIQFSCANGTIRKIQINTYNSNRGNTLPSPIYTDSGVCQNQGNDSLTWEGNAQSVKFYWDPSLRISAKEFIITYDKNV